MIIGLASAFSRFSDGDERYLFLVSPGHSAWLEPFIGGPSSLLIAGDRRPRQPTDAAFVAPLAESPGPRYQRRSAPPYAADSPERRRFPNQTVRSSEPE